MDGVRSRIAQFWRNRNVQAVMLATVPAFAFIPLGTFAVYAAFAGAFMLSPQLSRGIVRAGSALHARLPERVTRRAGVASNVAQWILLGGVLVASCVSLAGIAAAAYVSIPCIGGAFLLGGYRNAKWINRRNEVRRAATTSPVQSPEGRECAVDSERGSDLKSHELRTERLGRARYVGTPSLRDRTRSQHERGMNAGRSVEF